MSLVRDEEVFADMESFEGSREVRSKDLISQDQGVRFQANSQCGTQRQLYKFLGPGQTLKLDLVQQLQFSLSRLGDLQKRLSFMNKELAGLIGYKSN